MTIYLVAAIAALAGLLFGFDTGIISGAMLFIQKDFPLTTLMKEFIVSSVLLGAMLGSIGTGYLADVFGRRPVILVISGLFILGTLVASLADSVAMIVLGRFCIGLAIGVGSYTAPLYIAEVSPLSIRGGLVSLNQLAITIGIMCSFIIDYTFAGTEASWRVMFAFGIIPAVLLGIGMFFLPESPRWLIKQMKMEQAKKTLTYLRKTTHIDEELTEIKNSLAIRPMTFREIFSPWIRPVLFLGMILGFLQQLSGINTLIYYAPTIFQLAGFQGESSSILATVGLGIVNVLATIFAVFFLDKIGRRPLLLTGVLGMGLSLFCLGLTFHTTADYLRYAAIASTFVYIICFAISLGALLWLLVSEIFPLEVRGMAMGVAVFNCWFWNFVVSSTFLTLVEALGPTLTFFTYASMCIFGFIICYYYVPETKGVSLEEIEAHIRQGLPLREIGQPLREDYPELTPSKQTSA